MTAPTPQRCDPDESPPGSSVPAPIVAEHVVGADGEAMRLDRYAATQLDEFPSRKAAYKAAKRDRLLVNGNVAPPQCRLKAGDRIAVRAPGAPPPALELRLEVVIEDDMLAVVVKPPGIATSGNYARTVARALSFNLRPSSSNDALPVPHPVHRLDSPTGGLLLVAKTAFAAMELGRQFERHTVRKRYRAVVMGKLDGHGVVTDPVDGRDAYTEYRAVSQTRSLSVDWLSLVDLYPRTGRTHQLRRHMAGLGHPIIGDATYGKGGKILRGKGLFLWAAEIELLHPGTRQPVRCTCEPPAKFAAYLAREQRRYAEKATS